MDSRTILKRLEEAGWLFVSARGSHHKYRDPRSGRVAIIPHPKKDLPIGTVRSIVRQTGVKI